jgi:hypothetical protein
VVNGEMTIIKKIATAIGIIIGVLTIMTSGYYFVSDRFTVVAQVNQNTVDIRELDGNLKRIELEFKEGATERNKKIDDLIFNQKRMMEKLGIKWEAFRESEK